MTTIAWDGKTLATDGRATNNDVVENDSTKKLFKIKGGIHGYVSCAICGNYVDALKIIKWIKSGMTDDFPEIDKETSAAVICIKKNNTLDIYRSANKGFPLPHKGIYTDGSGWEIAMGAMDAGATAIEAVKIACRRDVHSGGKIQSYTFEG